MHQPHLAQFSLLNKNGRKHLLKLLIRCDKVPYIKNVNCNDIYEKEKLLRVEEHIYNPKIWEVETEGLGVQGQPQVSAIWSQNNHTTIAI